MDESPKCYGIKDVKENVIMKKFLGVVLAVVLVIGCLTGCKKEERTFTVGFDAEFPPYGYVDEKGEYVGFDLDLAAEVCKRRGWTVKYQAIAWDSKDMELASGNIDCIWNGFTMSDDRLDQYTWSKPYVDNSQVFAVAASSGIKTFADLAGKKVVVQAASSAQEALEADEALLNSFDELIQVPDYNSAFLYLEGGMADAVALDVGVANYQIAARDAGKFVILDQVLVSEQYGVGFLLGNTELRDKVQETLNDMIKDGTLKKIAEKWELTDCVILK